MLASPTAEKSPEKSITVYSHPLSLTHMVPAVTDGQVHAEDDEGGRHQVTPRCLPHNDRADAAQQADRGPHDGELQVREQRQQSVLESM